MIWGIVAGFGFFTAAIGVAFLLGRRLSSLKARVSILEEDLTFQKDVVKAYVKALDRGDDYIEFCNNVEDALDEMDVDRVNELFDDLLPEDDQT